MFFQEAQHCRSIEEWPEVQKSFFAKVENAIMQSEETLAKSSSKDQGQGYKQINPEECGHETQTVFVCKMVL
jgi:hypothetical protein